MLTVDRFGDTKIVTSPRRLKAEEIEEVKGDDGRWLLVAVTNVLSGFAYHFQRA